MLCDEIPRMSICEDEINNDVIAKAPDVGKSAQDFSALVQISNNLVLITKNLQETITTIQTTIEACVNKKKAAKK